MDWIVSLALGATAGFILGWVLASRRRPAVAKVAVPLSPTQQWSKPGAPSALPRPERITAARNLRPRDSNVENLQAPKALDPEQRKQRIRDRYVAARFAGALRDARELTDISKVIKAARLYFEDENNARGSELLQLAIAANPQEARLWLARLEILFLARDAERFVEVARAFQLAHPRDEHWTDITHLGHALAPNEPLFGRTGGESDRQEHYGPWPNTPNWIEAPWDLTAEIAGAEFHQRMRRKLQRRAEPIKQLRQGASH